MGETLAEVSRRVADLEQRQESLVVKIDAALTIHSANAEQIANNTKITLSIAESLEEFKRRALPVVEITENMQRGAAAMGKLIDFLHAWGWRFIRLGALLGALWVAGKLIASGGGWDAAMRSLSGTLK